MPIAVMERKLSQAIDSGNLSKVKKYYNVKLKEASYTIRCVNPDIFRFLVKKGFPIANADQWYRYAYEHNNLKILELIHTHIEPRTLEVVELDTIPLKIKELPDCAITLANAYLVKYELYHNTMSLADPLARAIVLDRADVVEFLAKTLNKASYIKLAMCYAYPKTILALSPDILHQAARYRRMDVFKYGKNKFKPDSQCMEIALINEDLKLVEYLYKFIPFDLKHLALEKLHSFVMPKADYDTVTSYYINKRNVELVKSRKRYTFNHINDAIDANCIEIVQHIITSINNGNFTEKNIKRAIEKHSNAVVEHFIKKILPEYIDVAIESANVWFLEKCTYKLTPDHLPAALRTGNRAIFERVISYVSVNEKLRLSLFIQAIDQDAKALNVLCGIYPIPEKAIQYAVDKRLEDALKKLIFNAELKQEYFTGSEAVEDELCRQVRSAHAGKRWTTVSKLLKLSQCAKVLALTKELAPDAIGYDYFLRNPKEANRRDAPPIPPIYAKIRKANSAGDLV